MNTISHKDGHIVFTINEEDLVLPIEYERIVLHINMPPRLYDAGHLSKVLYDRRVFDWIKEHSAFVLFLDTEDMDYENLTPLELQAINKALSLTPAGSKPAVSMHYPISGGFAGCVVFLGATVTMCKWELRGQFLYLPLSVINLKTNYKLPRKLPDFVYSVN